MSFYRKACILHARTLQELLETLKMTQKEIKFYISSILLASNMIMRMIFQFIQLLAKQQTLEKAIQLVGGLIDYFVCLCYCIVFYCCYGSFCAFHHSGYCSFLVDYFHSHQVITVKSIAVVIITIIIIAIVTIGNYFFLSRHQASYSCIEDSYLEGKC